MILYSIIKILYIFIQSTIDFELNLKNNKTILFIKCFKGGKSS